MIIIVAFNATFPTNSAGAGEILHVVESTSPGVQGHNAPTVQRVEGIDPGVSKALSPGE